MKKFYLIAAAVWLVAACSPKEETASVFTPKVFYGSINPATRTYTDGEKVYWINESEDFVDGISVFDHGTTNVQYTYAGETGLTQGPFTTTESATSEDALPYTYAFYPYYSFNQIYSDGTLYVYLPPTQSFAWKGTFGVFGESPMAAVSEDENLEFKNLAGYLNLRLYGDSSSPVTSVIVYANNGQFMAGDIYVAIEPGEEPEIEVTDDYGYASSGVQMVFDDEFYLDESEPADIWFCIAPGTYEDGIVVYVEFANGAEFEYSSSKPLTIKRSVVTSTAPLEVVIPELVEDPEVKAYIEENLTGTYVFNVMSGYDGTEYNNVINITYNFTYDGNVQLEGTFIDMDIVAQAQFDPETGILSISPMSFVGSYYGYGVYLSLGMPSGESITRNDEDPITFELTAPHTLSYLPTPMNNIVIWVYSSSDGGWWDWAKVINSITYQGPAGAPKLSAGKNVSASAAKSSFNGKSPAVKEKLSFGKDKTVNLSTSKVLR